MGYNICEPPAWLWWTAFLIVSWLLNTQATKLISWYTLPNQRFFVKKAYKGGTYWPAYLRLKAACQSISCMFPSAISLYKLATAILMLHNELSWPYSACTSYRIKQLERALYKVTILFRSRMSYAKWLIAYSSWPASEQCCFPHASSILTCQ